MTYGLAKVITHVVLPLLLGYVIYCIEPINITFIQLRNHLPDGLWAYSVTSTILFIWNNKLNIFWIYILFIFFILFEYFQFIKLILGTFDVIDIIVYFIFALSAILLNRNKIL